VFNQIMVTRRTDLREPGDTYAAQLELLTKATAIKPGYTFAYYASAFTNS
jgi:hypothetical protein